MNLSQTFTCVKSDAANLKDLYEAAVAHVGSATVLAELRKLRRPEEIEPLFLRLAGVAR